MMQGLIFISPLPGPAMAEAPPEGLTLREPVEVEFAEFLLQDLVATLVPPLPVVPPATVTPMGMIAVPEPGTFAAVDQFEIPASATEAEATPSPPSGLFDEQATLISPAPVPVTRDAKLPIPQDPPVAQPEPRGRVELPAKRENGRLLPDAPPSGEGRPVASRENPAAPLDEEARSFEPSLLNPPEKPQLPATKEPPTRKESGRFPIGDRPGKDLEVTVRSSPPKIENTTVSVEDVRLKPTPAGPGGSLPLPTLPSDKSDHIDHSRPTFGLIPKEAPDLAAGFRPPTTLPAHDDSKRTALDLRPIEIPEAMPGFDDFKRTEVSRQPFAMPDLIVRETSGPSVFARASMDASPAVPQMPVMLFSGLQLRFESDARPHVSETPKLAILTLPGERRMSDMPLPIGVAVDSFRSAAPVVWSVSAYHDPQDKAEDPDTQPADLSQVQHGHLRATQSVHEPDRSLPVAFSPLAGQITDRLIQSPGRTTTLTFSPEELGQVRISFQPDGQSPDHVIVSLAFDRPETLDLFRRHADQLADMLKAAGYAGVQLDFGGAGAEAFRRSPNQGIEPDRPSDKPDPAAEAMPAQSPGQIARLATLDLRM